MPHHGDAPTQSQPTLREEIGDFLDNLANVQKQVDGQHPEGQLEDGDEGAIAIGMGAVRGKVIVGFGKRALWVAWGPEQARELAQLLLDNAQKCDGVEAVVRRLATS